MKEDNAACHALVTGNKAPTRTKHLAVRIGFVRDLALQGVIDIDRFPTTEMVADPLTKALGPVELKRKVKSILNFKERDQKCAQPFMSAKGEYRQSPVTDVASHRAALP